MRSPRHFALGPHRLPAVLRIANTRRGLIVFAHGSGSGHRSPRNNQVAEALCEAGFATLLFDLLTMREEQDRRNVFDIDLLAARLIEAVRSLADDPELADLPVGLFGASTGAAAALLAASRHPELIAAVVSRGGRPDLAGSIALASVRAPTLLIVGSVDYQVIELNRAAAALFHCPHELRIVPGAGHLFEEPGALAQVIDHARDWFTHYLVAPKVAGR